MHCHFPNGHLMSHGDAIWYGLIQGSDNYCIT